MPEEFAATTGWKPVFWTLALAVAIAIQFPLALNHDAAWHFSTAFRALAGDRIGIDVFDINPPMSTWLFMLPAAFVSATGLSPAIMFKAFTLLLCSYGWVASLRLIERGGAREAGVRFAAIGIAAALLILPGYHFGQREHIVTALTLPYVLLAAVRASGGAVPIRHAIVVGIAAGVGIGVKPYFLALPLLIEAWLVVRSRSAIVAFRPETFAIVAVGLIYLVAVAIFAPAYYTDVVPSALQSYGGFERPWAVTGQSAASALGLPLVALTLGVLARSGAPSNDVSIAVLLAAAAFLLAALMQRKGWAYQLYPSVALLVIATALMLGDGIRRRYRGLAWSAAATAAAICLAGSAGFLIDGHSAEGTTARVAALTRLFEAESGGDGSVFAFVTSPRDVHPAVLESRERWASVSGVMVYLPAFVDEMAAETPSADRDAIVAISDRQNRLLLADLRRHRPAVILVDDGRRKLGMEDAAFDYIAFFSRRHPGFRTLWKRYEERAPIGKFRVFVRR